MSSGVRHWFDRRSTRERKIPLTREEGTVDDDGDGDDNFGDRRQTRFDSQGEGNLSRA